MSEPTWTCHICSAERLDRFIGVHKRDVSSEHGLPVGTIGENVRYCVDNPKCVDAAKTFQFFKEGK